MAEYTEKDNIIRLVKEYVSVVPCTCQYQVFTCWKCVFSYNLNHLEKDE